ncbi:hypothetical protein AB0N05_36725 [Nocardia sp. NPDC051030]|uniref:hypothetical protein n=1 Tax=Nocardia sp. NPDC051030 TaxID=3155162 RepID=UPI00343FBEFC
MAVGAVREKPAPALSDDTPGVTAPGEMSPLMLALLVVVGFAVVVGLIGSNLRDDFGNSGGAAVTGVPGSSTHQQPTNAAPAPAPPPRPAPAPPVQMAPAVAPVEVAPAPVQASDPSSQAAAPPPPPAPIPIPDILAPILPFLLPPPPPPPPPAP